MMEQINPYEAVFVLSILPTTVISILLRFIDQYPWLLDFNVILFIGILMVFTGGLWAAFQRDLGRLLGYAMIIEIGKSLLAISQPEGWQLYNGMVLIRILSFGVWALALSIIRRQVKNLNFSSVQGLGRRMPLVVLGVLVAHFSLASFPLLAGFSTSMALWMQLVQSSHFVTVLALLGSVGLMAGALRSLAVFVMGPEIMPPQEFNTIRVSQLFLFLGILVILAVGLFPQWFYRMLTGIFEGVV